MNRKRLTKLIHEGRYTAEIEIEGDLLRYGVVALFVLGRRLILLGFYLKYVTVVRWETAGAYLKAVRAAGSGGWGRRTAKPTNEVTTDSEAGNPIPEEVSAPTPRPSSSSFFEPWGDYRGAPVAFTIS